MLPAAKTNFKGNLFKNVHYFQRVGFTSVVGMFYRVVMVLFLPLRALIWPGVWSSKTWSMTWARRGGVESVTDIGTSSRCWFFVVLTLVGWLSVNPMQIPRVTLPTEERFWSFLRNLPEHQKLYWSANPQSANLLTANHFMQKVIKVIV